MSVCGAGVDPRFYSKARNRAPEAPRGVGLGEGCLGEGDTPQWVSKTWPRPRGSGLGLDVLASFNITATNYGYHAYAR